MVKLRWKIKRKAKLLKLEYQYHKRSFSNKRTSKSYKTKYLFWALIARRCMNNEGYGCGGGKAFLRHANCAYEDELSNYYFCCEECHEEIDAMYQEMWDEYNAGRL